MVVMRWSLGLVVCSVLLFTLPLRAQTNADIMTSREIAADGIAAFDAGDYARAAARLGQAYEIVKVPTIALYRARALVQLGRLVEASELYQEATTLEGDLGKQSTQEAAQQQARQERQQLLQRIPRLKVRVEGASLDDVEIKVDDNPAAPQLLREGYAVDPTEHRIVGELRGEVVSADVALQEGETITVTLEFQGRGQPASAASSGSFGSQDPRADQSAAPRGRLQRTLGWVGIGAGAGALAAGGVSGLISLSKSKQLDDAGCDASHECYEDQEKDVTAHNRAQVIANVGYVTGGMLAATGLTLLLTAPRGKPQQARLAPWVGWGQAGVRGRF